MRVVAISCVKNEVDIVEAFVRHTAAVTDHLIVLDNGSTDGTRDILSALQQRGLPLDVVDDPSIGHLQWKRMTRLMHTAALDCGADWVLPLDADEFFVPGPGNGIFAHGAGDVSDGALLKPGQVPSGEKGRRAVAERENQPTVSWRSGCSGRLVCRHRTVTLTRHYEKG